MMGGSLLDVLKRAYEIALEEGWPALLWKVPPYLYQQLWPFLPESSEHIVLNGVKSSQKKKILDPYLGAYLTQYVSDNQEYEKQYIDGIRMCISNGEKVVLIGGGEGISTVAAAELVQTVDGVKVYEGSAREVNKIKETILLNKAESIASVEHAIVGNAYSLRDSPNGAEVISPGDLPDCDILGIDADGAEALILDGLTIKPSKLIVEHHAVKTDDEQILDYQPDKIRDRIHELGYEIVEELCDVTPNGEVAERVFLAEYNPTTNKFR